MIRPRTMSADPEAIVNRLEELRLRWWLFSMLCNVVAVLLAATAALLLLISLDCFVGFADGLHRVLLSGLCLVSFAGLCYSLHRAMRRQRSLPAAARRIEMAFPEVGNSLINLVQLAEAGSDSPDGFRQAALREAADRAASIPLHEAARDETRIGRWQLGLQSGRDLAEFALTLLAVLLFASALSAASPRWSDAARRCFSSGEPAISAESSPLDTPAGQRGAP